MSCSNLDGLGSPVRSLFKLAAPIILSQLAQIATGVVDVIMAGHLDPGVLGAISTGAAIWTPTMIFLLGILYAIIHGVGSLRGQGLESQITSFAARGCFIGLSGGAILGMILYFGAGPLFERMELAPELIEAAKSYSQLVAFGFPGLGLFIAIRFLIEASGAPFAVTATILCSIIAKIGLNQLLVFGALGFTPLGVEGFGLSTALIFWGMALMLACISFFMPRFRKLWGGPFKLADLAPVHILNFLRHGIPIGLNFLSDYLVMAVIALFIASIGSVAISGHQVVYNIISVFLMFTTGISMAGAIMVSKSLGGGEVLEVKSLTKVVLAVSVGTALTISVVMAVLGNSIIALYTPDLEIQTVARPLLNIAATLFTIDVIAISLGFILRGLGKPNIPFGVMLVSYWLVSIPLGYALARTSFFGPALGLPGWWYGLLAGVSVAAVSMSIATIFSLAKLKKI